ncbi:hypothetical protein ACRHK7_00465 [Weissella tructae]|uniref:hypothetical protein n=1 Tax=Weissella tructae TaxID=887702 RepID=UPI003D9271E2
MDINIWIILLSSLSGSFPPTLALLVNYHQHKLEQDNALEDLRLRHAQEITRLELLHAQNIHTMKLEKDFEISEYNNRIHASNIKTYLKTLNSYASQPTTDKYKRLASLESGFLLLFSPTDSFKIIENRKQLAESLKNDTPDDPTQFVTKTMSIIMKYRQELGLSTYLEPDTEASTDSTQDL